MVDTTASASTSVYQFYLRTEHSILNLEIDPVPIGIVIEPSSGYLVKAFRAVIFPGWEGLRLLWKRKDWGDLHESLLAMDLIHS